MPVYLNHMPAGTSTRTMIHMAQNVKDKKFQMYDFGTPEKNVDNYGQVFLWFFFAQCLRFYLFRVDNTARIPRRRYDRTRAFVLGTQRYARRPS